MHGGSYVVLRRVRIALEHWDRMPLEFQEQSVGRHKLISVRACCKASANGAQLASPLVSPSTIMTCDGKNFVGWPCDEKEE